MSNCDDVYEERNQWALAFVKSMKELGQPTGYRVPEKEDDERLDDDDEQSDWCVIWAITPNDEEVSAHIPRDLLPDSLERGEGDYDGYEPSDNYRRLRHYYG